MILVSLQLIVAKRGGRIGLKEEGSRSSCEDDVIYTGRARRGCGIGKRALVTVLKGWHRTSEGLGEENVLRVKSHVSNY